jgi:hypothetical protein
MPTSPAVLAKMLAFDGLTASFGWASGPCQRDLGLVSDDFAGRSTEAHVQVVTGITSVLVRAADFAAVRAGDLGTVCDLVGNNTVYLVRDRELKNDGALLRLYLQKVASSIAVSSGSGVNHGVGLRTSATPLVAIITDDAGTPVVGAVVNFSGTGFTFASPSAITDGDGLASSGAYGADDFGNFVVEATSPGVSGTAVFVVEFVDIAPPPPPGGGDP